jgi:hypothetical protein
MGSGVRKWVRRRKREVMLVVTLDIPVTLARLGRERAGEREEAAPGIETLGS